MYFLSWSIYGNWLWCKHTWGSFRIFYFEMGLLEKILKYTSQLRIGALRCRWMKNKAPMIQFHGFMKTSLHTKVLSSRLIRFAKTLCTMFLSAGWMVKNSMNPCIKWSRIFQIYLQSMLRNKDSLTLQDGRKFRSLRVGSRNACSWLSTQIFSVDLVEFVSSLESKSLAIGR